MLQRVEHLPDDAVGGEAFDPRGRAQRQRELVGRSLQEPRVVMGERRLPSDPDDAHRPLAFQQLSGEFAVRGGVQ